ncbi:hypothetical protein KDA_76890 [Dictyobacter alpinus]|uniref:MobA/VirD2-like nuclease domain-containing protein n=1 Tax=Dictyobacter alpinus TaxID=2014873 RepID=A0A402BLF3_9CHLR|nr:relaxase/mobilization nuclease domain-containing protein [Dictyobacter alpinus]GCE32205.1 hypothetical protein KDA_76890 [Dictyobacter alpinus]
MIARGHYVAPSTRIGNQWHRFDRGTAGKRLSAHFRYIEYRARGKEESRDSRHLFTALAPGDEDNKTAAASIPRREALESIMSHTGQKVYFHQFILSCAESEQVSDGRTMVREVMRDFERERNMRLTWYAVEHTNTEHRHWHIVLAGSGEDRDTGERRDVLMAARDYQFLRETAHELSDHEFTHQIEHYYREDENQERQDMRELASLVLREDRPGQDHQERGEMTDHTGWTRIAARLANQGPKQDRDNREGDYDR